MEIFFTILWGLVAGLIIGPLARLVLPGKQNISIGMTILIGAAGAILGGLIAGWIGVGSILQLIIQVAVAALVVVAYGSMSGRPA